MRGHSGYKLQQGLRGGRLYYPNLLRQVEAKG